MPKKEKDIYRYDKLLQKYVDRKDIIQVARTFKNHEDNINGFLLNFSNNFILMQREIDFMLDGYCIIPKDKFDSTRRNKTDLIHKKILKKIGITQKEYGIKAKLDLTNWNSVFKSLKKNDFFAIIECEDLEEPTFFIGPITRVNKKSVSIHYFDSTGQFDEKPVKVKFEDITIVVFDDRYTNTYRKYLIP